MNTHFRHLALGAALSLALGLPAQGWWNPQWATRQPIVIDLSTAQIGEPVGGSATVLLRLHEGNFPFLSTTEDGHDIRIVAEDEKTVLPLQIEKYDALLNEGFVWVKAPAIKPGRPTKFWIYAGNPPAQAETGAAPFDEDTVLVYHFSESGPPPIDATGKGNNAEAAGVTVEGSLIGSGVVFDGHSSIVIPAAPPLQWIEGNPITWSAWIKPLQPESSGAVFSRKAGSASFLAGLAEGVPYVEIGPDRTPAGEPLAENAWHHLAVVAEAARTSLYVDGKLYGMAGAGLPASNEPLVLGSPGQGEAGFAGEMDEVRLAKIARSAGAIQLAAIGEGTGGTTLLNLGEIEGSEGGGHSNVLEHVALFGDIAHNMMFDGWIAVGICAVMVLLGWTVAIRKFIYLNSIQKGSELFMKNWQKVSTDLTVLDHDDPEFRRSFGGEVAPDMMRHLLRSPLYHIYLIGSDEIEHRLGHGRGAGLSARSIQAIRSSLDTGMVHENQRMNKGLIWLTISIAGGPYVGLLGTVVGVMITFAIIAKSGEVDVNSIAPGIASALLATVAGLVVAIPALFIYSYLSSRIRELLAVMQVFIDEFIAKMAEFYPVPSEAPVRPAAHRLRHPRDPEALDHDLEAASAG